MRTAILILSLSAAACAVESAEPAKTSTNRQGLICDPCDPGNFQALVSAMVGAGGSLGSPVGPVYCHVVHGYNDYGDLESWNECTNHYQSTSQRFLVDCADLSGEPVCASISCGSPIAPSC